MKYSTPLIIATALSLTVAGCFRDTPTEPGVPRVSIGSAAITVGTALFLGHLGGGFSSAYDIDNSGAIVGVSKTGPENHFKDLGFLWENGTMRDLGALEQGGSSAARGITGSYIAGQSRGSDDDRAVRSTGFSWTDLGFMSGGCPRESDGYAVNSSGHVVGWAWGGFDETCDRRAALWSNGSWTDLGSLGGAGNSGVAYDINDNGQVVGKSRISSGNEHAFLWQNGAMSDLLGTLGGSHSEARGINSFGQIAGFSTTTSGSNRAFLWEGGALRDLGTLGGSFSRAYGINDNRQVVGESQTSTGQTRAFVWYNGKMDDFGPASRVARAINNKGQAVGEGTAPDGSTQGVRWTIPLVNLWTQRAVLPAARRAHAAGVANGLLYVMGGVSSAGTLLRTVVAYNPGTNSWSTKASMPAPRHFGNGAAAIGSTIYVAGGSSVAGAVTPTSSLYAYNASTNSWSTKANMPVASGCGGSAVISSKLYVFSGCTRSSTGATVPAGLLHRYDPSTNAWTTLRAAPAPHDQPAVGVISGKLYVAGGTGANRLDVYNPATNTWITRAAPPTARHGGAGVVVGGRFHVIGGLDVNTGTNLNTVEAYDHVTNYWGVRAPMPTARRFFGVGVINNLVYAVGGHGTTVSTKNERYKP